MSVNLESAARRHLLGLDPVKAYVQNRVWAWRMKEEEHPNGKGTRGIRLRTDGSWSDTDSRKTGLFPVLVVECWADYSRDGDGNKLREDNIPNARAVWQAVHPVFHGRRHEVWGATGSSSGLTVASSRLWTHPVDLYADDQTLSDRGRLPGVVLGDCAVVVAEYAIELVG